MEDIRAHIYAARGAYELEIKSLKTAIGAFLNGFSEYHRASIERAIKLATAYQNNGQPEEAARILLRYLKIAEEMLGPDAGLTRTISTKLTAIPEIPETGHQSRPAVQRT